MMMIIKKKQPAIILTYDILLVLHMIYDNKILSFMFNASRSVQRTVVVQMHHLCYQVLITDAPRSCLAALAATHAAAAACARSSR